MVQGGFGFEYVREPRAEPVTRRYFFEVTHKYYDDPDSQFFGIPSRCYLDSLPDERCVEERFKGKMFSFIT